MCLCLCLTRRSGAFEDDHLDGGPAAVVEGEDRAALDFCSGDDYPDETDEADWVVVVEVYALVYVERVLVYVRRLGQYCNDRQTNR